MPVEKRQKNAGKCIPKTNLEEPLYKRIMNGGMYKARVSKEEVYLKGKGLGYFLPKPSPCENLPYRKMRNSGIFYRKYSPLMIYED